MGTLEAPPGNLSYYQATPLYPADGGGLAPDVYLIAPFTAYQSPTIVVVPNIYQNAGPLTVPAAPSTAPDFVLGWNGPGGSGPPPQTPNTSNVTLTITIPNANQWKSAATARAALRANFALLAQLLDNMEFTALSLVPGGAGLVLRRVAEALPAPLRDSLFFFYGFNTGLGTTDACPYVDLRPGMRLLVEPEPAQFIAPAAAPQNGPAIAAPFPLELHGVTGADGFRRIGFDSFLAAMAAPTIIARPLSLTAPQVVAGGLADLQAAGTARRYYRLFYPGTMPDSYTTGDGTLATSVTLVGAETLADMAAATAAFQTGQSAIAAGATPLLYWVLRGRTTLVPQVMVNVNRSWIWVTLGTTLRDLVDRYVVSNPYAWDAGRTSNAQLTMYRSVSPSGKPLPTPLGPVAFNVAQAILSDPRVYNVPLIQGDVVVINVPNAA